MDLDDLRPKPKPEIVVSEKLEAFSVSERESRIAVLREEIVRVESELSVKRARVDAAEALFKS